MTPDERAPLQSKILAGIRASDPENRPSQRAVANVLGFDETEYKRFARGERKFDIDELVAAAEAYGPDAVLGPLAERFGRRLVSEEQEPAVVRELQRAAARLTRNAAELGELLAEASTDGRIDPDEAAGIQALVDAVGSASHRVCARPVRVGAVR